MSKNIQSNNGAAAVYPEDKRVEEFKKVYVHNLSWNTTEKKLKEFFSVVGKVVDCKVLEDSETGRSRGHGFVTFDDLAEVKAALDKDGQKLDGSPLQCQLHVGVIEGAE